MVCKNDRHIKYEVVKYDEGSLYVFNGAGTESTIDPASSYLAPDELWQVWFEYRGVHITEILGQSTE